MRSPSERLRDLVRRHLSLRTRRRIAFARLFLRRPTAGLRALPDFLVIGGQRCGTSSLYRYLGRHPEIMPPLRKEVEYFSARWVEGEAWYRCHFPPRARLRADGGSALRRLTFEATPDYLLHPLAAGRAAALLPDVRLVALVRDPVLRAWSHWRHNTRLGIETLSFEEALAHEDDRIAGEAQRIEADPGYRPRALFRFSYRLRGRYAAQIERWLRHYPRQRLLVVRSEDLFRQPRETYHRILDFLGLPEDSATSFPNYSYTSASRPNEPLPAGVETARLADDLAGEGERLSELLGEEIAW